MNNDERFKELEARVNAANARVDRLLHQHAVLAREAAKLTRTVADLQAANRQRPSWRRQK